jgi:hypothetical protein
MRFRASAIMSFSLGGLPLKVVSDRWDPGGVVKQWKANQRGPASLRGAIVADVIPGRPVGGHFPRVMLPSRTISAWAGIPAASTVFATWARCNLFSGRRDRANSHSDRIHRQRPTLWSAARITTGSTPHRHRHLQLLAQGRRFAQICRVAPRTDSHCTVDGVAALQLQAVHPHVG